jgi:hypothetical protein
MKKLLISLILLFAFASFTFADGSIDLSATWEQNDLTNVEVQPGELPNIAVAVSSTENFQLWVELLQGSTSTTLINGLNVRITDNPNYFQLIPITTELESGDYNVRVYVRNSNGDDEEVWMTLHVANVAPVVSDIPSKTVNEGNTLIIPVSANDANNDNLVLRAFIHECLIKLGPFRTWCNTNPLPESITFSDNQDGTGTLKFVPGFDFVNHPDRKEEIFLQFEVNDGILSSEKEKVKVTVIDVNRAPKITSTPSIMARENEQYIYQIVAQDADGDRLYYGLPTSPAGMSYTNSGKVFWTPNFNQAGVHEITVAVEDVLGAITTQSFMIEVKEAQQNGNGHVVPTNHEPLIITGNKEINEGQLLQFNLEAEDADNDNLLFGYEGDLPDGADLTLDGEFTWTPSFDQAGKYNIRFTVSDGTATTEKTITITVNDVPNSAPVITVQDYIVNENELLIFPVGIFDIDGDSLTLSHTPLPAGASFNFDTLTFTWTPNFNQAGIYPITFSLTDGIDLVSETSTITVGNTNRGLSITSQPIDIANEGENYRYQIQAVDQDNDPLIYTLVEGPRGMTIDNNGLVEWKAYRTSSARVVIFVSDGDFTVTQRFTINARELVDEIQLSKVSFSQEVAAPGDYVIVYVNLDNEGRQDLEDVRVVVTLPELGIRRASGEFDLDRGDDLTKDVVVGIPYFAWPGQHLVMVTVQNDDFHDTTHRIITVN